MINLYHITLSMMMLYSLFFSYNDFSNNKKNILVLKSFLRGKKIKFLRLKKIFLNLRTQWTSKTYFQTKPGILFQLKNLHYYE